MIHEHGGSLRLDNKSTLLFSDILSGSTNLHILIMKQLGTRKGTTHPSRHNSQYGQPCSAA